MGKIKSKQIKRSAKELVKKGAIFDSSFEDNKKRIGMTMPSKKIRNQMAGYLVKFKKEAQK